MKIQLCAICERPFFPRVSTIGEDKFIELDPYACPQCNANARKNSQAPLED